VSDTVIDRRREILDAASALFSETGSRGTSIAAVAARAGLTDAGVLYHFKTKKALVLAVLEHFDLQVEQAMQRSDVRGIELLRATREWGAGMEQVPEVQSMLILLSAEHLQTPGPARDYVQRRYRRLLARYVQAFEEAVADGDLRPGLDARFEAGALIAHLDGIRFQWFLLDRSISMADSVRTYVDSTLARLAPTGGSAT
jgi:AcrR family transcriptional regulator